jgi:outer membrane protein TolC
LRRPTVPSLGALLAGLVVLAGTVGADELPEGSLRLQQAIRIGLHNHPGLEEARAEVAAGRAGEGIAGADYRPQVYAEGSLAGGRQLGGTDEGEFTDDSRARLSVEQELYDFGGRAARSRAASAQRKAAESSLFDARQQRALTIQRRYFDVLLADRKVQVWNEALAIAYVRYDYAQGQAELGEISPVEESRIETRFRDFRAKYLAAQNEARLARLRLSHAMGIEGDLPRDLVEPDLELERELAEVQDLVQKAWDGNPRLAAARHRLSAARARADAEASDRWPRLVGAVNARYWSREAPYRNDLEAALRLEVPLYEGGRLGAEVRRAGAQAEQVRARWMRLRQDIERAVYEAHLDVDSWRHKLTAAQTALSYRQKKTDLARTEYMLELETDLGDALTEQTRAQLQKARARYKLALSLRRLDALVGQNILPEKGESEGS